MTSKIDGKVIMVNVREGEMPRGGMTAVEIAAKAENKPGQLSSGQQQRVAIAWALATRSPILMAGEPTRILDSQTGR